MAIGIRTVGDVTVFDIIADDLTRPAYVVPTLHDLVSNHLSMGKRNVLVNFGKAEFVDSFGIGQIISSFTSTLNLGGGFKLCDVPQKVLIPLLVTRIVPHVIKVYPDEASALTSFADPAPPEDPTNK